MPEGIPFPSTRLYAYIAKYSPFTGDWYTYVARRVASRIVSGRVLDVGTGPGYLPIEIVKVTNEVEVVGIDVSKDMIRIAEKNAQRAGVEDRVRFEVVDAKQMHYEDSSFDLVVSTGSFHHWKKPIQVLNEIYRVLKPHCYALIYELRKDPSKEDLEKLKERYGRLVALMIFRIVSFHSAVTTREFQEILENPENDFRKISVEDALPLTMEAILTK